MLEGELELTTYCGNQEVRDVAFSWLTRRLDADLRLEDPRAATLRALPRFRQPALIEHKPARLAARGDHENPMPRRLGGADGMAEVVFDVAARKPELARQRRHRSRLIRQQVDELSPVSNVGNISVPASWPRT